MSSPASFGSSMLFQTINDDLNASLATADELSREFNSLLKGASSDNNNTKSQTSAFIFSDNPQSIPSITTSETIGSSNGSSKPFSPSSTTFHSLDSIFSSNRNEPSPPPVFTTSPHSSPKIKKQAHSPLPRAGSDSYSYGQQSPKHSPHSPRRNSPSRYDRSPRGSISYADRSPSPSPTAVSSDQTWSAPVHSSSNTLSPYDSSQMGRRSPRLDRARSPLYINHPMSNTLPRNFAAFRKSDEGVQQQQKSPGKWNETDLDVSYEKKSHHTYDKTEWLRPSLPSSWRESNLDGPPPAPSPKKDPRSPSLIYSNASLPRNIRIAVPPDVSSPVHSPYYPQPIISRISIPPTSTQTRQRKPIPLSVIMRLQNPHWGAMSTPNPRVLGVEGNLAPYPPPMPFPREFFHKPVPQLLQHPPELRQPAVYSDALNSGDIEAELERLDFAHQLPVISENPNMPEGRKEGAPPAPRPLSPTRLQPVVDPEAQRQEIPNLEELLRMRAEIPRALKRRGSVDQSQPLKRASHYQPNQYKNLINKLFRRKDHRQRGERGSETSSSSDGEEAAPPPAPLPAPTIHPDFRSYHSILRRSKREHKSSGRRARLSPLVLLLDGALVGELDTVQRAVQEMNDPSQPNDEGITALHNAICGGHYNVVDFLVRIGANVSAPDSHGWTPLHCSASCNDRPLCEFLVRNGAAVMAVTESDAAIASQKCDPYAEAFEACENFLKGVEEAMGVENSGVLYALWSYPAQAADELSFKEGDMVTILQKPEGSDWWWASLCGREGFVPNSYFGLFPKVRPKSLC
ncbi:relA-associated inhibitor [Anoplopoma fimbria]|uniref:relA-associated inhibitor n=1 Tax=Anoplopoma fimbria TaxID=229290 RepID=UPI0023EDB0BB|nr:relA-associated inhibitor [Anoplopoma fimbria]XP_054483292.1 relA-associated inhibitor [Anoplopoma fimbria]XP_054483331.1 relA-associated inhibitor [Anoplopoma fimbria]XP_054483381.1 relA-associated inhibitor [Anoplopoma fimbria]XP_054483414.1 relA-associated inhibitor [Anoplopoma fimbria]